MGTPQHNIKRLLDATTASVLGDPDGGPAAVAITFAGGDYVVPTGESSEDLVALRHLLMAFFRHRDPPPEPLRVAALRLVFATLRLAAYVSRAAGMDRLGRHGRTDALRRLPGALQLSRRELEAIAGEDAVDVLAPLLTDHAAGPWEAKPLLRDRDGYVVVGAAVLVVALRHQLIVLADRAGWRVELAERLRSAYGMTIDRALERLDWHPPRYATHEDAAVTHEVWGFDADAAALVTIVGDDLTDYDTSQPESPWHAERYLETVATSGSDLLGHLLQQPNPPQRLAHLVVLAGTARPAMWFDTAADDVLQAPQLSFFAGDLESISMAERGDPLALWRFALDADREGHRFIGEDPLELFALWRSHHHSFYLGDGPRPIAVPSIGYAGALRREIAVAHDRHGLPGPAGRGLIEVVRRFDDLAVPIYKPMASDLAGLVVDDGGLRCWVLAGTTDRTHGQLVDAVAFWVWQLAGDLGRETLEIEVSVGHALEVREVQPGRLEVSIDPTQAVFRRQDNAGERELVRSLLRVVTGDAPNDVVERVAPLGPKKMVLTFGPSVELALDGRRLPPPRLPLRESDDAQAMDELGVHLQEELGLTVGPIPQEQRVSVLWSAIEFHLDALLALLRALNPDGLLESLIVANEQLLNEGAFTRYTVPTRMACFGEFTDIETKLRGDLERNAAASTALRFVIECVAAHPPSGVRPPTLAVQDRLVALAHQITSRGTVSDAIREGLDDTELSVLASGRLGVSREGRYFKGRERFAERFARAEVWRSHRHFPSLWVENDEPTAQVVADAERIDAAAQHEWGATMAEILEFFGALVELADGAPASALPLEETLEGLADMLDWPVEKVRTVVDHFALVPRAKLLEPESPFGPHDVYPWRYGRRLSAIRRPLIIRPGTDGDELVYGFRSVDAAGRHLVHEMQTARLKVETPQLRDVITKLRKRRDIEFNARVADLYRSVEGLRVRERVKKVGRLMITRDDGNQIGDVDVLVADPSRRVLQAIDTKNLAAGRTPMEIARELKRTFESDGSDVAAIEKHAERAAWLERHLAAVLAWLGLDGEDARAWRVEPSIVVDEEVPAAFVADLPMRTVDFAMLADELARSER
ncbi:MAG TPA: hypothetical protein VGM91_05270 [Conexibacter sp.]|jgi:hypothetical protein